ncbi:MAG: hypothetical protein JST00_12815 [Deltaproteobacteria bacterium]|nr:hypothetical protein [Deltaproteobacteria bacterium]
MSAKQKIESLTNSWYGYFFFGALLKLWNGGFGLFNLASTAFTFALACLLAFFLGRRLGNRSSLTRFVLVCISGLFTVLGAVGTARMGWMFFQTWQLGTLLYAAGIALSTYMYGRSFRVLTDASVKAYINQ